MSAHGQTSIADTRRMKAELERTIRSAIESFETATCLRVDRVDVVRLPLQELVAFATAPVGSIVGVNVQVRL